MVAEKKTSKKKTSKRKTGYNPELELGTGYVQIAVSVLGIRDDLIDEISKAAAQVKALGLGEAIQKQLDGVSAQNMSEEARNQLVKGMTTGLGTEINEEFQKALASGKIPASALKGLGDDARKALAESMDLLNAEVGRDLGDSFKDEIIGSKPEVKKAGKELGDEAAKALDDAAETSTMSLSAAAKQVAAGMRRDFTTGIPKAIGSGIGVLTNATMGLGRVIGSTAVDAAKLGVTTLGTSIGLVGAQIAAGGFSRALSLNESESKLQALGYVGEKFNTIMQNASNAVDGTAYAMNESVGISTQLLAANIKPGKELEGILKNVGKLADMTGSSFSEIGTIISKNASAGVVQWTDLTQIIDRGVPIQLALAKQLGVSAEEVKKMASASEISFDMLNKAIDSLEFDSVLFATKNIGLAFRNVKAQLSRIGEKFFTPIFAGLTPLLNIARTLLSDFIKSYNWDPLQTSIAKTFGTIEKFFRGFMDGDLVKNNPIKSFVDSSITSLKEFAPKIKGYEGIVGGAMIGLVGSALSSIPVIGGLFANVTPAVGIFSGAIFQAYKDSELLQSAVGSLAGTFKGSLSQALDGIFGEGNGMQGFGDFLAGIVSNFEKFYTGVLEGFINKLPEIKAAFGDLTGLFDGFSGGDYVSFGETLGAIAVGIIKGITTLLPAVASFAGFVTEIVASEGFLNLMEVLKNIAVFLFDNQGFLIGGFAVLATISLAKNLIPFLGSVNLAAGKVNPAVGAKMAIGLTGIIKSVGAAGSAILKATPHILKGIAGLTIILGALTAVGWLAGKVNAAEHLGSLSESIVGLLEPLVGFLGDILRDLVSITSDVLVALAEPIKTVVDLLSGAFEIAYGALTTIALGIMDVIVSIGENINNLISSIFDGIIGIIESSSGFLSSATQMFSILATDGAAIGAGAFAAAAGIGALMLSLSGGSALGNLAAGGEDRVNELLVFFDKLAIANSTVLAMPAVWLGVSTIAYAAGLGIAQNLVNGFTSQSVGSGIQSSLDAQLATVQTHLDANPLVVRTRVDDGSYGPSRESYKPGNTTNNNNKTNNYNVSNGDWFKSLIRDSR